jgi:hypothetical protein
MDNEQEWRARLFTEIDGIRKDVSEIKNEMSTLKVKVALFSSAVGSLATFLMNKFL